MNGSEDLPESYDFDLIVIGGGSGGLAAAKARLLVGYVGYIRSPGSPWGLSGPLLSHFAH